MAIQLRYLQTLIEVSGNQSSTIVFPLPIDVLKPLVREAESRLSLEAGTGHERLDEALTAARRALDPAATAQND